MKGEVKARSMNRLRPAMLSSKEVNAMLKFTGQADQRFAVNGTAINGATYRNSPL